MLFFSRRRYLSFLLVSALAGIGYFHYHNKNLRHREGEKYCIRRIIQSTNGREQLNSKHLAEILGLSFDLPTNLYAFDLDLAKEKLLADPWIKSAAIQRLPPHALYVEYELRQAVAFLGDFPGMGVDNGGNLLPFTSFFTSKKLPIILLGHDDENNELTVKEREKLFLALRILSAFYLTTASTPKQIDLSSSLEECQLLVEEQVIGEKDRIPLITIYPSLLRFYSYDYQRALLDYLFLKNRFAWHRQNDSFEPITVMDRTIIDLRVPSLAFYTRWN